MFVNSKVSYSSPRLRGPISNTRHIDKQPFRGGEMLTSPARDMNDTLPYVPWAEKKDKRLFFRGGPTGTLPSTIPRSTHCRLSVVGEMQKLSLGMFHSDRWDWRSGQRDRAAFLGDRASTAGMVSSVLTPCCGSLDEGWTRRVYGTSELVKQYLDVGVVQNVSRAVHCLRRTEIQRAVGGAKGRG